MKLTAEFEPHGNSFLGLYDKRSGRPATAMFEDKLKEIHNEVIEDNHCRWLQISVYSDHILH